MDFILDIETLDQVDSAIILSLAILPVDFERKFKFEELLEEAFFVKFKVDQQKQMGRTIGTDVVDFWKKQSKEVQKKSFFPSETDQDVFAGIGAARSFMKSSGFEKNSIIWTRGSLDFSCLEHLCTRTMKVPALFPYYRNRDIRTAVDILSGSDNGYAIISEPMSGLMKHDPIHDCASDAMQLRYYIES